MCIHGANRLNFTDHHNVDDGDFSASQVGLISQLIINFIHYNLKEFLDLVINPSFVD